MNSQSNQGFSTFDTISIIMSVVVIAVIIVPILSRRVDSQNIEVARDQAEQWSQKITSLENLSVAETGGRTPASVQNEGGEGAIGSDPWGKPYRFQFIRNAKGQPVYVVVWSDGPNAQPETAENEIGMNNEGKLSVNFLGDDVGYIRAVR